MTMSFRDDIARSFKYISTQYLRTIKIIMVVNMDGTIPSKELCDSVKLYCCSFRYMRQYIVYR